MSCMDPTCILRIAKIAEFVGLGADHEATEIKGSDCLSNHPQCDEYCV